MGHVLNSWGLYTTDIMEMLSALQIGKATIDFYWHISSSSKTFSLKCAYFWIDNKEKQTNNKTPQTKSSLFALYRG